jgi:hypothetical protein
MYLWDRHLDIKGAEAPLALDDAKILAIVSDDQVDIDRPIWPRSDILAIAANVRKTLGL